MPAVCAAILLTRWVIDRQRPTIRQLLLTAVIVLVSSAALVWTGYGFNIRAFVTGVSEIARIDREGMNSYALGRWTTNGWWWYFPLSLGLKTTLPFLALFTAGFIVKPRRVFIEFTAASIAILMIASRSRLDIGVRYVLPVFIPMTIAVAAATLAMMQRARWIAITLILLHLGSSIAAHPDYFPYFNVIAGSDPSRFLIDSNLDWEQDALRLRHVVRELKIESLMVRDIGAIDYARLGFPHVERYYSPFTTLHGWVAIGDSYYREGLSQYGWPQLRGLPYRRVGKSIRLYCVECGAHGAALGN